MNPVLNLSNKIKIYEVRTVVAGFNFNCLKYSIVVDFKKLLHAVFIFIYRRCVVDLVGGSGCS